MAKQSKRAGEINIPKLCDDIYKSRLSLRRYRDEMRELVREMVGRHWSDEGTPWTVPLNLINIYQSIITKKLVSANPRVMLSTWQKPNQAAVGAMQEWVNEELENMNFAETEARCVTSALYSIGVVKVGIAMPANAAHKNWDLKVGEPYAEEVLLDDFVFDMHARTFEEVGYIGHRYRVPLEFIKDSKLYTKERLKLQAQPDAQFNREGDERIGVLGRSFYSDQEDYGHFVDLWEIYDPLRKLIITLPDQFMNGPMGGGEMGTEPLRVVDWVGPDGGPYHILRLGNIVPGNCMPAAPLQNLKDLHDPVNNILRKLIRQAQRMKEVLVVGNGSTEDAKRIEDANDGDIIRADNPDLSKETSFGGPNPEIFQLMGTLQQLFSWAAGNLDLLGGLSPQSKTATQDKMLNENSSSLIMSMQEQVVTHARSVVKSLCWYWWYHPKKVMDTTYKPAGMEEYQIPRSVYPAQFQGDVPLKRTGRLSDMKVRVDPYSLQGQTPQSRMAAVMQIMQQLVIPMLPVLQQQGNSVDFGELVNMLAKYSDLPDLLKIVKTFEAPQQSTPDQSADSPPKPGQTERTYNRISQSNETSANKMFSDNLKMTGDMSPNETNGTVNR